MLYFLIIIRTLSKQVTSSLLFLSGGWTTACLRLAGTVPEAKVELIITLLGPNIVYEFMVLKIIDSVY